MTADHSGKASSTEEPAPGEAAAELDILDPSALQFCREDNRLQMQQDGEEAWCDVSLARLFALSEPERWISVLEKEGKEIGVLLALRELSPESLRAAREELHQRYLVPQILQVLACRDRFDMVEWTVQTDRGQVTFLTRNLREKVQRPLSRHLILTDVEDTRYDIPDVEALNTGSRRWLDERL